MPEKKSNPSSEYGRWKWGDWWGALCLFVTVAVAQSFDLSRVSSWWIAPAAMVAVGGYVVLNRLQDRLDDLLGEPGKGDSRHD